MGITEGVDVEDVDVSRGEEKVLEELSNFSLRLHRPGRWST